MPAASDGLVCRVGSKKHTSIAVTTGVPDIRLSLHDERYGLCLMCSGQPAESPVTTAFALRLRPVGRLSTRGLAPCASTFRFGRTLSAPAIMHGGGWSLHTGSGTPPPRPDRRARGSQRPS